MHRRGRLVDVGKRHDVLGRAAGNVDLRPLAPMAAILNFSLGDL
jgi:hypothetical protein